MKGLIRKGIVSICLLLLLTGCVFKRDTMEDIDIYTTIYPYNYLLNYLYGNNAKIHSIYPGGVDIDNYDLSDRKIQEYSKSSLFVFNSLDKDRDYAVKMINETKDLKVIDVSLGMTYTDSVKELWLNPYNYLMMAGNVRSGLNQYISNPYLLEEIETNYNNLKYDLSKLDASLKESSNNANFKTIVTDSKSLKFLEKYNLTVISLDSSEEVLAPKVNEVKKLISEGEVKYIYSFDTESNADVNKLIKDDKVELITLNDMNSIDGKITNTNENYLTIMNDNIDKLKKELYK